MRYALVNPQWHFEGSIYFGCHEPHLPLEFGYAKALLEAEGHEVLLLDAHRAELDHEAMAEKVVAFGPEIIVLTTAPTYLFWRCPPPELRVPQQAARTLSDLDAPLILVGPHGSTTPEITLRKVGADAAVMGECEEVLPRLAEKPWRDIEGLALLVNDRLTITGGRQASNMAALPALRWPTEMLHEHHHHRFDGGNKGLGAELEASRGCPYACTFCAKDNFRDKYRKRPLETIFEELDRLVAQGVGYVYFVDEILLPDRGLLEGLARRDVQFGVQTRIDLWKPEMLDLLGEAGCVSIEAGVESISEAGRDILNKRCRLDSDRIKELLVRAKRTVPFVQASLIDTGADDPEEVENWRQDLLDHGVWANKPVPMFPYPGSPSYVQRWGLPDGRAWERAVDDYLANFDEFSDIQEERPLPLSRIELPARR